MKACLLLIHIALIGCHESRVSVQHSDQPFLSIIGSVPAKEIACVDSRIGYGAYEFSGESHAILDWLYNWNISHDRFDLQSFDAFAEEATQLIKIKKFAILFVMNGNVSVDGVTNRYHIQVSVREIVANKWNCRVEILHIDG